VCDACGGLWLDQAVWQWLRPLRAEGQQRPPISGRCLTCGARLAPVAVAGPTTSWIGACNGHGLWLGRRAIASIEHDSLRRSLVRASIAQCWTLPEQMRHALLGGFDAVAARMHGLDVGLFDYNLVRSVGNSRRLKLGMTAVANGGITVVSPDGRVHGLSRKVSRYGLAMVVGVFTVALVPIAFLLMWATSSLETAFIGSGFTGVFMLFGVGMFAAMAMMSKDKRIVFDQRWRTIDVFDGDALAMRVPFALATSTRVQLFADAGYGDAYDVLIALGFAELWIHQPEERKDAHALARKVADILGVQYDPEEQRKG
jgi:hypothetical protein